MFIPESGKLTPKPEYLSPYAMHNGRAATSSIPQASSLGNFHPSPSAINTSDPAFVEKVNEAIARAKANNGKDVTRGSAEREAIREPMIADMQLPRNNVPFPLVGTAVASSRNDAMTGGRRGRGHRKRESPAPRGTITVDSNVIEGVGSSPGGRSMGNARSNRGGRPKSSRARGGRASIRGGKRKRSEDDDDDDADGHDDTDASENFTPLPSQSRSGRKIFQANVNTPIIKIDDELLEQQSPPLLTRPPRGGSGKNKPRYRRPPGATAVCKNCGRGHSPSSNVIVFCDGCNTPWHQHCHDPPIKGEIVQIEEKEWFCADCSISREEEKRLEGRVAGNGMSLTEVRCEGLLQTSPITKFIVMLTFLQKRQYFHALPHDHLVSLLLHSCTLHPSLPIFEPKVTPPVPAPVSSTTIDLTTPAVDSLAAPVPHAEEYYEADILPYPKPGNGIMLSPESEDISILLDDDVVTFSHSWLEGASMVSAGDGYLGIGGGTVRVGA